MFFGELRNSLLDTIRIRVRNGELTERGLAKSLGVSQPHLHNVLKGTRCLSVEMCDHFLAHLHLSTLDLLDRKLLQRHLGAEQPEAGSCSYLPVLLGKLGPDEPWPERVERYERFSVPVSTTARMFHPVVVRISCRCPDATLVRGRRRAAARSVQHRENADRAARPLHREAGEVGVVRRLRRMAEALYAVAEDRLTGPRHGKDCR